MDAFIESKPSDDQEFYREVGSNKELSQTECISLYSCPDITTIVFKHFKKHCMSLLVDLFITFK